MAWYKDASLIHPEQLSRFQLLADGSLQISGLLPDDTGMFQCFARNAAGEVQTTTYLAVTSRCQPPSRSPGCPAWDGTSQTGTDPRAKTKCWEGLQGCLCISLLHRHRPQHHEGSPGQHGDRWHVRNPQL